MKKIAFIFFIFVLMVLSFGGSCERRAERNVPQSGPLVGKWKYVSPMPYQSYQVVAGDHSWWIPEVAEFREDGTLKSQRSHDCHYWIEPDNKFKLDCRFGQTRLPYRIEGSTLIIPISSWANNKRVNVVVSFERVD